MTHEELLAICDNYSFKDSAEPVKALRAVVELHKPVDNSFICRACYHKTDQIIFVETYPCPTIQAIQEQIK